MARRTFQPLPLSFSHPTRPKALLIRIRVSCSVSILFTETKESVLNVCFFAPERFLLVLAQNKTCIASTHCLSLQTSPESIALPPALGTIGNTQSNEEVIIGAMQSEHLRAWFGETNHNLHSAIVPIHEKTGVLSKKLHKSTTDSAPFALLLNHLLAENCMLQI